MLLAQIQKVDINALASKDTMGTVENVKVCSAPFDMKVAKKDEDTNHKLVKHVHKRMQ